MDTKEFLHHVLPTKGTYMGVIFEGSKPNHIAFDSIDEMAERLLTIQKLNPDRAIYHACASYKQGPYMDPDRNRKVARVKDNWAYARSFWIDIDCGEKKAEKGIGYATQADAAVALAKFCKALQLPNPTIVSSGYGLHAYFTTDEDMAPDIWCPTALNLKRLLEHFKVLADPARTADFASILRPVGSFNNKYGSSVEVHCMRVGKTVSAEKLRKVINDAALEIFGVDAVAIPDYLQNEDLANNQTSYLEYPVDADICADKCNQIAIVRDTQGDACYEHWRGTIGILKFCEDGRAKAEQWTARRHETGHDSLDWQTRFDTWESAPTTCAFFEHANPEGCKNCPFKGQIKTPLVLGRIVPETEEPTPVEEVEPEEPEVEEAEVEEPKEETPVRHLPDNFAWQDGTLIRFVEDKKGVLQGRPFTYTYFYLETPIINAEGCDEYVVVCHHPKTHKLSRFNLEAKLAGCGGSQLMQVLGAHSIIPIDSPTGIADMTAYIRNSIYKVQSEVDAVTTVTHFGWQKDNSFVIGNRAYLPGGEEKEVLLAGNASKKAHAFAKTKASLSKYVESLNWIYNREGMEPLQYAICSLWGSILTPFCDVVYKGIPCILSGASTGKGKTSAGLAAMYAFGNAQELAIASKEGATQMALTSVLGTYRNLPLLLDEMTNISAVDLSRLAYALASGMDRARLRSTGGSVSLAEQERWASQSLITCNSHMTATLIHSGNSEAEAMRLFEIRVDKYNIPLLDPVEVARHLGIISENCGVAGDKLIEYTVAHQKEIQKELPNYAKTHMFTMNMLVNPKYRFYRYHASCTLMAAEIMKKLGIIDFDLTRLKNFAMIAADDLAAEVRNNAPNGRELIAEILEDLSKNTIETPLFDCGRGTYNVNSFSKFQPPLKARLIIGSSDTKDKNYDNTVIVYVNAVRDWLYDHRGMDISVLGSQLKDEGIIKKKDKLCLGKGIYGIGRLQDQCWVLDLKKLSPERYMDGEQE